METTLRCVNKDGRIRQFPDYITKKSWFVKTGWRIEDLQLEKERIKNGTQNGSPGVSRETLSETKPIPPPQAIADPAPPLPEATDPVPVAVPEAIEAAADGAPVTHEDYASINIAILIDKLRKRGGKYNPKTMKKKDIIELLKQYDNAGNNA